MLIVCSLIVYHKEEKVQGEFVFMHLDKQGLGAYNEEKTKEVTQCCTLKLWNRICNPQSRIDGLSLLYLFVNEKNSHRLCFAVQAMESGCTAFFVPFGTRQTIFTI